MDNLTEWYSNDGATKIVIESQVKDLSGNGELQSIDDIPENTTGKSMNG